MTFNIACIVGGILGVLLILRKSKNDKKIENLELCQRVFDLIIVNSEYFEIEDNFELKTDSNIKVTKIASKEGTGLYTFLGFRFDGIENQKKGIIKDKMYGWIDDHYTLSETSLEFLRENLKTARINKFKYDAMLGAYEKS